MLKLFLIFFKIGASTFGGGYAMLPIIERELVDNYKLINKDDFIDFISIAQSFPGPIAVNMSVLIGNKINGISGAIFAMLGVVMPSFLSILIVGFFYIKFSNLSIVKGFFKGVNAVVPALLLVSLISIFKKTDKKCISYLLIAVSFILLFVFNINPLWTVLLGGISGICTHILQHT